MSDSRQWTISFERRNHAWSSLSSYFVSGSTCSFSSRRLVVFVKLKNSRNIMHEQSFCKFSESKVQHLIAQNRRFRFKLEFKAEQVYFRMLQCAITMNQFTAAIWSSSALNCNGAIGLKTCDLLHNQLKSYKFLIDSKRYNQDLLVGLMTVLSLSSPNMVAVFTSAFCMQCRCFTVVTVVCKCHVQTFDYFGNHWVNLSAR